MATTNDIIWLNGAFGVGKTTVTARLADRIPGARIADPERIGWVVRRTFWRGVDYQDVDLWRRLTVRQVTRSAAKGPTIVPMTVVRREVLDHIAAGARRFVLMAPRATIVTRIDGSDEAVDWRLGNLDRCLAAFEDPAFGEHIDTEDRTADQVADAILARLDR